jgi:hypothetical protein
VVIDDIAAGSFSLGREGDLGIGKGGPRVRVRPFCLGSTQTESGELGGWNLSRAIGERDVADLLRGHEPVCAGP